LFYYYALSTTAVVKQSYYTVVQAFHSFSLAMAHTNVDQFLLYSVNSITVYCILHWFATQ